MQTFTDLVKEEDRNLIKFLIEDGMYKYITPTCCYITPTFCNGMQRIDILILYAKKVKELYLDIKTYKGICIAKSQAMGKLNNDPNMVINARISEGALRLMSRRNAMAYVGTCTEWEVSRESDHLYWWKPYYNDDIYRGRCSKPRILFLDWVIDVLTAYKNEYVNI